MKYLKIILTIFLTGLLFVNCDDYFEELNINPNGTQKATPDLLLPTILGQIFSYQVGLSYSYGNTSVEMITKEFDTAPGRYNWSTNNTWSSCYSALKNTYSFIKVSEKINHDYYIGIGLILKSYLFSNLTQIYGDVPYSEAVRAKKDNIYTPIYDSQEEIFKGIFADLEKANEYLNDDNINKENLIIHGDIVYNNNVEKWRKFGNSLRLRLLLRLSNKWDISSMVREIVDNPAKYPLMENNNDNFQLKYLSEDPYKYPPFSWRDGDKFDNRMAKGLTDTLLKFNDSRITMYANPTSSSVSEGVPSYVGIPSGMFDVDVNIYNGGTQFQSYMNKRYFSTPDFKHPVMQYSELQFILAESSLNGWINGPAEQYYLKGVSASFSYHGVAPYSNYYEQSVVKLSGNPEIAIKQILIQKWIAFFNTGMEAYFEYRRTGIPKLTPGPANENNNQVPVRFLYPLEEQSLNEENYKIAIGRQGPDDINTKMWMLK